MEDYKENVEVKKTKKFPFFIIPIVIAVLVIAGVAAGLISNAYSDEKMVEHAIKDFVNDFEDYPIIGAIADALRTSHTTVKVTDEDENYMEFQLWSDYKNKKYVGTVKAKYDGGELKADRSSSIYLGNEYIIVDDSQGMLGDVYGISRKDLLKKFQDSIFYPDSGSKFALDVNDELLENIENVLEKLQDGKDQKVINETQKYLEKYYKKAVKLVKEICETTSEKANGNRVITIKIGDKEAMKLAIELLKAASKDKKLISFLNENYNVHALTEGWESYVVYDEIDEEEEQEVFLSNFKNEDADYAEVFGEWIEELEEELDEYDDRDENYSKSTVNISITVSSVTRELRNLSVKFTDSSAMRDKVGSFELNASEKDIIELTLKDTLKYNMDYIRTTEDYEFWGDDFYQDRNSSEKYTLKKTEDGYSLTVKETYNGESETAFTAKLKYKDGDKYTLTFDDNYTKVTLSGKLTQKRNYFFMSLTSIKVEEDGGENEVKCNISVEVERNKKLPEVPAFVDVLTLEESDFEEIADYAENFEGVSYVEILSELLSDIRPNYVEHALPDDIL